MEHDNFSCRSTISWRERGRAETARWLTTGRAHGPERTLLVDDRLPADTAYRLATRGTGLLWRGDYRGARQVLDALNRRLDRRPAPARGLSPADAFHRYRQARAYRAQVAGRVLVELDAGYRLALAHAPDVRLACREVYGAEGTRSVLSLRELLGVVGAHQWRCRGVAVEALAARVHPHYGVFAPTRTEYLELFAAAPLPPARTAIDVGTGTGVLAAILARRGVPRVLATDIEPRAVACARDNVDRLGLADRVTVLRTDLFPPGRAELIVCNPPWVPGTPTSTLESGVFDRGGRTLARFIQRLPEHLTPGGEAWLLLSDLPELLGLRPAATLPEAIAGAGLAVRGRLDRAAALRRPTDTATDPLASIRARETISLWRLAARRD